MSPFPVQMQDHWSAEPPGDPARKHLAWFMLFAGQPQVAELAQLGQARLAGLPGLDLVPPQWLHLTTFIAGYRDEITPGQAEVMTRHARQALARTPPARITLGRVLYHSRAVVLDAGPAALLEPVLRAVQEATRAATGQDGWLYSTPWTPHITLAYSNMTSPAAPVIAALGRQLPERTAAVSSVSLVAQAPEQRWTWDLVTQVTLGTDLGEQPSGPASLHLDQPGAATHHHD